MMAMMKLADEHKDDETYCAAWLPEGRSFVIRNPDEFVRTIVPQFFKATKFSSFTRKLYRWGFRQINRGIGPDDMIIFGNEFFDRDNEELMSKMRSITAAGTRKSETRVTPGYGKRSHDSIYDGNNDEQKRFFELMQHSNKNPHFMHPNAHIYGGGMVNDNSGMHIMRPPGGGMGGNVGGMDPSGSHHHQQMMGMNKSYDMMHQGGPNQPMPMMNNQYNANGMQLMQPQQSMPNPGNNNQGYNGGGQGYSGNAQGNNPGYNGNNQGYNGQNQGYIGNNQGYNGNNQGYSGNNQGYTNNGNNSNASGGGGGGGSGGSGNGGGNGSGNNQSTSEIVNAAIRALQFST